MKSLFGKPSLLLLFPLLLALCTACNPDNQPPEEPPRQLSLTGEDGKIQYTIVYPQRASTKLIAAAETLASGIQDVIGSAPQITADAGDNALPESSCEILLGQTARSDASAFPDSRDLYRISVSGDKVLLATTDDESAVVAVHDFLRSVCGWRSAEDHESRTSITFQSNLSMEGGFSFTPKSSEAGTLPCIVETRYETTDVVIADIIATESPYNADPTGQTDSTDAINRALADCRAAGGGTVWLPAGTYTISSTVNIPEFTVLRGDWNDPDKMKPGDDYGTLIRACVPVADDVSSSVFHIAGGAGGAYGLTVWYPEQSLQDVKPYYYTFYNRGGNMLASVTNCTVLNGYRGIGVSVGANANTHEMFTVDGFRGTFLSEGFFGRDSADVGTFQDISISPDYWVAAGEAFGAPAKDDLTRYTKENAIGMIFGGLEWAQLVDVRVQSCRYGIQTVRDQRVNFSGNFFHVYLTDCEVGLKADVLYDWAAWGIVAADCRFEGSRLGLENRSAGYVKLCSVEIVGGIGGSGKYTIEEEGDLSAYTVNSSVSYFKPNPILYVANIAAGPDMDVSDLLQRYLDAAGQTGGIVYLPAGHYRIDRPLTVPAGVELRGSSCVPTRDQYSTSAGTMIYSYRTSLIEKTNDFKQIGSDNDQIALITLRGDHAGLSGLRILFPGNTSDKAFRTDYAVRGLANGHFIVNCAIVAASHGVDFGQCNDYFIQKLITGTWDTGMRLGGKGGHVEGCLQNGTTVCRNGLDAAHKPFGEHELFEKFFGHTKANLFYIVIVNAEDLTLHNTFAFGALTHFKMDQSKNILAINFGSDGMGTGAMQLRANASSGVFFNALQSGGQRMNRLDKESSIIFKTRLGI